jgi:hypothetical protein
MRAFIIIILGLLCLRTTAGAEASGEAEATAKRYAEAVGRFDAAAIVDELHSDTHQLCNLLALHIYNTTEDEAERSAFLKSLGVASLDAYKELTPKAATVRFFEFGFLKVPRQLRDASAGAKITVVGSLIEKDTVHVLYRSEADFEELSISVNVPSVVTLKRDGDRLKVISTTQLESVKAKLRALADRK